MAILTLATIRYATYVGQQRKIEAELKKKRDEELKTDVGKKDLATGPDAVEILAAN